jgi:NitT/TauT family transport system permease protein/sulfonate transport system permease protein
MTSTKTFRRASLIGQRKKSGGDEIVRQPSKADHDPVGYRRRRRRLEMLLAGGVPVLFVGLWEICIRADMLDRRFFPAPSTIVRTGRELIAAGTLQDALLTSTRRVLLGFLLGTAVGMIVGIAMALSRWLRIALDPLLSAFYTVPKLALLPLLLLIFGLGERPIVFLIAISVFFFVWISTMEAISQVPLAYRDGITQFTTRRWPLFRHVLLPASLPAIFVGMRIAMGVAVLVMVAAEFVQGRGGIGYLIWNSWNLLIARRMYVGIVCVALMGVVTMYLVRILARILTPWADEQDAIRL